MLRFPPTDDLRRIEKAGSLWASLCVKDLFEEKDLEFFATRYQPFYEYLKEIEGLYQSIIGEFDPFNGPCMQLEEVLAEKIRATYQRATARDIWDLYQYATRPYDRDLVKRLAVIKFWNDESDYDPMKLLDNIRAMKIDFSEVGYLLKNQEHPKEEEIKSKILSNFGYLGELDEGFIRILGDTRKHRESVLVKKTCEEMRLQGERINSRL